MIHKQKSESSNKDFCFMSNRTFIVCISVCMCNRINHEIANVFNDLIKIYV